MKRAVIVLLAVSLGGSACNWFENPAPTEARLVVDGDAGNTVRVIVSTRFVASVTAEGQTRVVIIESDTVLTTLPYERIYRIEQDRGFFAETARLDADLQNVRMQVFVDHRKQFDEAGALRTDQPYRFVYTFNQVITRDIVVL